MFWMNEYIFDDPEDVIHLYYKSIWRMNRVGRLEGREEKLLVKDSCSHQKGQINIDTESRKKMSAVWSQPRKQNILIKEGLVHCIKSFTKILHFRTGITVYSTQFKSKSLCPSVSMILFLKTKTIHFLGGIVMRQFIS